MNGAEDEPDVPAVEFDDGKGVLALQDVERPEQLGGMDEGGTLSEDDAIEKGGMEDDGCSSEDAEAIGGRG